MGHSALAAMGYGVWKATLKWSRYDYRTKEGPPHRAARADEDEKWVAEKERKELYIDTRSGSIVDFLDAFEACFAKHVVHRSILARQTAAARTSERELRPGILTLDMDFAENGEIEEARKLQSEHWLTKGFTLYIVVVSWVDMGEWNKTVGELRSGDTVLVDGEMACMEEELDSHWAEVVGKFGSNMGDDGEEDGEEDVYLVRREAGADPVPVARSRLRHRVIEKQCHPVISDDKTHDSYAMQCFVAKVIQHLKGDAPGGSDNVILKQGLTSLCIHSDNAKQHFKSSKSIYFFTKQLVGGSGGFGFTSITWDFGAPGHG